MQRSSPDAVTRIPLAGGWDGKTGFDQSDYWFEIVARPGAVLFAEIADAIATATRDRRAARHAMVPVGEDAPAEIDAFRDRLIQLRYVLRGWNFTYTDESGAEEAWPLPDEPAARAAEIDALPGPLSLWLSTQTDLYYQRDRIAPVDPPSAPAGSNRRPSTVPASNGSAPSIRRPVGVDGTA